MLVQKKCFMIEWLLSYESSTFKNSILFPGIPLILTDHVMHICKDDGDRALQLSPNSTSLYMFFSHKLSWFGCWLYGAFELFREKFLVFEK